MRNLQQEIIDKAKKLIALTDNLEPGLFSWNMMCERTFREMKELFDEGISNIGRTMKAGTFVLLTNRNGL